MLIAAPTSGCGKTTVALGLLAALRERGLRVQPFKCGPDYIDTKFHHRACGRPSINLDTFMATPDHVATLFGRYGRDADVCVVEGMMGLFDGYDRDRGSSAEIAAVLGIPVVLVVDARSAAYSLAPLLAGFAAFRHDVRIAGVIFNKVGSQRHRAMLQQVCRDLQLRCYGFIPRTAALEHGSRYLGLDFSERSDISQLAALVAEHVDVDALLADMPGTAAGGPGGEAPGTAAGGEAPGTAAGGPGGKAPGTAAGGEAPGTAAGGEAPGTAAEEWAVAVARNAESFSFIYQENLDRWHHVTFFDPETDVPCLDGIDLLYLPGGYPEKHLQALAANEDCRMAIRNFAQRGGRVAAECGGMMYLCEAIVTDDATYPMCGVLPHTITARTAQRRLSLGYRRFVIDGVEHRGHEFHYTQFLTADTGAGTSDAAPQPTSVCQVYDATGASVATPVLRYKNVVASYTHLYTPFFTADSRAASRPPSAPQAATPAQASTTIHAPLRPLMLAGTGSDVGKSVVATALCRIFRQDGYHPAPFKAQNMALNSYATPEGLEIGRAQAVQAEAAGIPCHTDMNPLLLKPNSNHTSQVVLHGRPIGNRDAYSFWRRTDGGSQPAGPDFRAEVCGAFDRLAQRYNPIVMEGAGSISEVNLRATDLVNMPMARHADAAVVLVADIDRGGVFASAYGSIMLQTPADRARIKGIIVNKFRGDMRLFDEGRRLLHDICGVPVIGVVPYYDDIYIEEEDSVSLANKRRQLAEGKVNIAVVLLRHLSNFTDFDTLEREPRVNLFYTNNVSDLAKADIIILPGTKATLDDLLELRRNGCAAAIQGAHRRGTTVVGICGGYQMMGLTVNDPDGIEGSIASLPGLALLPINTTMSPEKTTRQVSFTFRGHTCRGYEIHQGVSSTDQAILEGDHCIGTYIHGFLDNAPVIDYLLHDKSPAQPAAMDPAAFKETQYDRLADHVRRHLDMDLLYSILKA